MERWTVHVLRHLPTGMYFGKMADHVKALRQARRWYSPEELETFLQVSIYAPKDRENYQPVEAEMMIGVNENVQNEPDHRESGHGARKVQQRG